MARLPYVDAAQAAGDVREVLERLPVKLNIFRLMANAEENFKPLILLGTTILGRQKLSGRLRELAILHVARLSQAEYEWVQHVPIGKATGIRDEQIEALEKGRLDAPCFDAEERAVLRFTEETVRNVRVPDDVYDALASRLSPREIVELVIAIGFYMTIARLMEVAQIDLDPPAGTLVADAARR